MSDDTKTITIPVSMGDSDDTKTITIPVSMGDWENDFRNLVMEGLEFQWCFPITTTGELVFINFVQEDEEEES